MESLVKTVRILIEVVRMRFGLQKCAMLTMKRSKREDDVEILLPDNEIRKGLREGEYKYLGVLEVCDIKTENMKETVAMQYKRRLKLLLKFKLNVDNMIRTINTWMVGVIRYPA